MGAASKFVAVPIAATAASALLRSGPCNLGGWTLAEDAGTPASCYVRFRDGLDVTGPIIAVAKQGASGWDSPNLPPEGGVRCETGLYMEMVSGTVEGAVYVS